MAADETPGYPHGRGPEQQSGDGGPEEEKVAAASGGAGRAERSDF